MNCTQVIIAVKNHKFLLTTTKFFLYKCTITITICSDEEFVLAMLNKTLQVEDKTAGASRTIANKMSKKNHKFFSYIFVAPVQEFQRKKWR
jgi:hypothetical protein